MHRFLHRTGGAVARLLVLLLALGTSVPFAAHGDADHDPCDTAAPRPGASTSLEAPSAPVKPQHCDVCHWLRSLRSLDAAVSAPAALLERAETVVPLVPSQAARRASVPTSSRAPPA